MDNNLIGFMMGPLPTEPVEKLTARVMDCMKDTVPLTDEQKKAFQEFEEQRKIDLESYPNRGLIGPGLPGWSCPNCGGAHSPTTRSCPEPPRGSSLRKRLKMAE